MNTKHTPGPWTIYHGSRSIFSASELIATMEDLPSENDKVSLKRIQEYMANARLIAAAPELLYIVNKLASTSANDFKNEAEHFEFIALLRIKARKVIAKTTGEV